MGLLERGALFFLGSYNSRVTFLILFTLLSADPNRAEDGCSDFRARMKVELGLQQCRMMMIRYGDLRKEHSKRLGDIRAEMETSFQAFLPRPGLSVADAVSSAKSALTWARDALKNAPGAMSQMDTSLADFLSEAENDLAKIRVRDRELRQPIVKGDVRGLPKEAEAVARAVAARNKGIEDQRDRDRQSLMIMNDDHESTIKMVKDSQESWRRQHECYLSALAFLKKRLQDLESAKLASLAEVEAFMRASQPMTSPRKDCDQ